MIALYDTTGSLLTSSSALGRDALNEALIAEIADSLHVRKFLLERLLRYRSADYSKIESLDLRSTGHKALLALLAVVSDPQGHPVLSVMVIDPEQFIRRVLGPKFGEIAGEDLLVYCRDTRDHSIVLSTAPMPTGVPADRQTRRLWLFRDFELGIRLRGTTIEELARTRFVRNGLLFLGIDILLIAGVILVYRSFRREMQLAQLKSDFVSNVSHELKTPLSLIRMFAETLEMDRVPNERKKHEYYTIIVRETERLTRLINNILTFSRIEAGKKEYHFRTTDLNRVVEEVMNIYRFHLEQQGFTAETELDSQLPQAFIDEEAVAESLINLIDNAMKYSDRQKYVAVRTYRRGGMLCIEVEDHGVGIAPEHRKHVFEKFYRVSGGLVHTAKGSGLGLSLVDTIVQAHHGHVELDSTPGEGSRFRLCFPEHAGPANTPKNSTE